MCSEVLRLILSRDYSWDGEDFTSWREVSGGPPNSIRTLLAAERELSQLHGAVGGLLGAEGEGAGLHSSYRHLLERVHTLHTTVSTCCIRSSSQQSVTTKNPQEQLFQLVTPTPKGRVREIIASLQKASAERGHRPHTEIPDAGASPNLEVDHAAQGQMNKGEFRGLDLLQWVERVCGLRGGKAVCEGLLQLGVLESREEGGGEEGFSLTTTYCWRVRDVNLREAWPASGLQSQDQSVEKRRAYTEEEHRDILKQVERDHSLALEVMQARYREEVEGLREAHKIEAEGRETHIRELRQELQGATSRHKHISDTARPVKKNSSGPKSPVKLEHSLSKTTVPPPHSTVSTQQVESSLPIPPPPPPPPPLQPTCPPPPPPPPPLQPTCPPPPPPHPPLQPTCPPPPPPHPPLQPTCPPPPPPPLAPSFLPPAPPLPTRVDRYKPQVEMKPLFWRRLQYSAVELARRELVWGQLHEPELLNVTEFEKLFARKKGGAPVKRASDDHLHSRPRPPKVVSVLDQKRSQTVGILVRSLHVGVEEVKGALLGMDCSLIDTESLAALRDNRGTEEELLAIRSHLKNSPTPLDKPDMFLFELAAIPQFEERVSCFLFQTNFPESLSVVSSKISTLRSVCQSLRSSPGVCEVLGLVLALGNVMNCGNLVRGQADGFDLECLGKLRDIRASDNSCSLLQFIVQYYVTFLDQHAGTLGALFPLPNPTDLLTASHITFDDIRADLQRLSRELHVCSGSVERVQSLSPPDLLQPFQDIMQTFTKKAASSLESMDQELGVCEEQFSSLVEYYCVRTPPGQQGVSPHHFFSLWFPFARDFREGWACQQRAAARRRQKAQQVDRVSAAAVKPVTKTGLKARLKAKAQWNKQY